MAKFNDINKHFGKSEERINIDIRNNFEHTENWNQYSAQRASKFYSFNIWSTGNLSQKEVIGT